MRFIYNQFATARPRGQAQTQSSNRHPAFPEFIRHLNFYKGKKRPGKAIGMAILLFFAGVMQLAAQVYPSAPGPTQNYLTKWNNVSTPTINNSQIFDNTTNVGIGTATPTSYLHLFQPSMTGVAEQPFQIQVSDAPYDFFQLNNGTTANVVFSPYLWGNCQGGYSYGALNMLATTAPGISGDVGTAPLMTFGSRTYDPTIVPPTTPFASVANRNLFAWLNNSTTIMQMEATGKLDLTIPAITGAENSFQLEVSDAHAGSPTPIYDYFNVSNLTSLAGTFAPLLQGHIATTDTKTPMYLIGSVETSLDDVGNGVPMMAFDARTAGGAVLYRPLFTWNNDGTAKMQMNSSGDLGIGTTTPGATLDAEVTSSTSDIGALKSQAIVSAGSYTASGANFFGINNGSGYAYGLYSKSETVAASGTESWAVWADAYSDSHATGNTTTFGIYAAASGPTTNAGLGNYTYAGFFGGDVFTTGLYLPSDIMLKNNIQPMAGALSNLMKLQPKTYEYNTNDFPSMHLPVKTQMGFLAQDLEQIYPNLVQGVQQPAIKDTKGNITTPAVNFKSVNYIGLIPVIISAMQEEQDTITKQQATIQQQQGQMAAQQTQLAAQQAQNAQLQGSVNELQNQFNTVLAEIEELKTIQAQCCGSMGTNTTGGNSSNEGNNSTDQPSLAQNAPNPFTQNTVISYYLPASMPNAVITIRSMTGTALQSFTISSAGHGQITVSQGTLAPATYEYDMVVNGKVIDSKKMIIVGE